MPAAAQNQANFNRDVSNAFQSFVCGYVTCGDLKLRSTPDSIVNHILADGKILNIVDYPELGAYYGNLFGGNGTTTFALPNHLGDILAVPPTSPVQTVEGGTVTNADAVVTNPTGAGQTGGTDGGAVDSGGRARPILREGEQQQ